MSTSVTQFLCTYIAVTLTSSGTRFRVHRKVETLALTNDWYIVIIKQFFFQYVLFPSTFLRFTHWICTFPKLVINFFCYYIIYLNIRISARCKEFAPWKLCKMLDSFNSIIKGNIFWSNKWKKLWRSRTFFIY